MARTLVELCEDVGIVTPTEEEDATAVYALLSYAQRLMTGLGAAQSEIDKIQTMKRSLVADHKASVSNANRNLAKLGKALSRLGMIESVEGD